MTNADKNSSSRPVWFRLTVLMILLILPALACGESNPRYQSNNQIRLAVYEYERSRRGPVDDLVLGFQRDEPRIHFEGQNQHGGRTIWLYRAAAREFFALRPKQATYLYIQDIEYNDDNSSATVNVFRGDGSGYQGRALTLNKAKDGGWIVTNEVETESEEVN
jgi:hypothetical protein